MSEEGRVTDSHYRADLRLKLRAEKDIDRGIPTALQTTAIDTSHHNLCFT